MSSSELRWEWIIPDKPGVWAFGGHDATSPWDIANIVVLRGQTTVMVPGWWCFLMPLPTILPPKKKAVWRMWILPKYYYGLWSYMPLWCPECQQPSRSDAIRTDKTEEREE